MLSVTEQRLERIEEKLDRLSETVAQLARIEERLLSVFKRLDRHEKILDDQEDEIRDLTSAVLVNSNSVKFGDRLFWLTLTGCTSLLVYMVR